MYVSRAGEQKEKWRPRLEALDVKGISGYSFYQIQSCKHFQPLHFVLPFVSVLTRTCVDWGSRDSRFLRSASISSIAIAAEPPCRAGASANAISPSSEESTSNREGGAPDAEDSPFSLLPPVYSFQGMGQYGSRKSSSRADFIRFLAMTRLWISFVPS